jgi:hypothetical protein
MQSEARKRLQKGSNNSFESLPREKDYSELLIDIKRTSTDIEHALQKHMYGLADEKSIALAAYAEQLEVCCGRLFLKNNRHTINQGN